MTAALRKGWCPGALRPMPAKDGLLVRLRITGGILTAAQAHALADLAERCGNGSFDLSGRGNLQMRGVGEDTLAELQDGVAGLGMLDAHAEAEAVRNVIASPLAGLHGCIDIRPLTAALEARLAADRVLHALPGKFGFLVDDGAWPTLAGVAADVRFDWTGRDFAIGIGGSRAEARRVGFCAPSELSDRAAQVAAAFLSIARKNPGVSRLRQVSDQMAAALPSPACGRRWPDEVGSDEGTLSLGLAGSSDDEAPHPTPADAGATFSREREKDIARCIVGRNAFDCNGKDLNVLGLAAPFGRLDARMLRSAAAAAGTDLRLTPWRVILLPGAAATHVPGFITDPADRRLAVAACPGARGCARGTTDTHADAAALAALLPANESIALHVSGCEKGCAKPSPAAVTLVARDGRYDVIRDGRAGDPPWRRGLDLAALRDVVRALA